MEMRMKMKVEVGWKMGYEEEGGREMGEVEKMREMRVMKRELE